MAWTRPLVNDHILLCYACVSACSVGQVRPPNLESTLSRAEGAAGRLSSTSSALSSPELAINAVMYMCHMVFFQVKDSIGIRYQMTQMVVGLGKSSSKQLVE